MLVEFVGKILIWAKKWRWFGKYVESTLRGKLIFIGIGLAFFVLCSQIFQIFGLFMLYFPRLCAYVILVCFAIPFITILTVPFMGVSIEKGKSFLNHKNADICIFGIAIAAFGLFLMIGLGFFVGWDWFPNKLRDHVITSDTQFPLNCIASVGIGHFRNLS